MTSTRKASSTVSGLTVVDGRERRRRPGNLRSGRCESLGGGQMADDNPTGAASWVPQPSPAVSFDGSLRGLVRAFERCRDGETLIGVITARSGSGKTALLQRAYDRLAAIGRGWAPGLTKDVLPP